MTFFPYPFPLIFFFPISNCLSDTVEKAKSDTNSSLQTIRNDNHNKLIFANLNINSIRNKFDSLANIIKDNFDV